jgi:exodeoxyribonuclease III
VAAHLSFLALVALACVWSQRSRNDIEQTLMTQHAQHYMATTVITFNIRSVRSFAAAGGSTILPALLREHAPTLLFLQETHLLDADVAACPVHAWLQGTGYRVHAVTCLSRSSSGLLAIAPDTYAQPIVAPTVASDLFQGRALETHIAAPQGHIVVLNVYVVHSGMRLEKADRRAAWDAALGARIQEHVANGKQVLVCGDLNVAPTALDLANPTANRKRAGFTEAEREGWTALLRTCDMADAFRAKHPGEAGCYSFWTLRVPGTRERNVGWRLDGAACSNALLPAIERCDILTSVTGSDHAPLLCTVATRSTCA